MTQPIKYKGFEYFIDTFSDYAQAHTFSQYLKMGVNFLGADKEEAERNIKLAIDRGDI